MFAKTMSYARVQFLFWLQDGNKDSKIWTFLIGFLCNIKIILSLLVYVPLRLACCRLRIPLYLALTTRGQSAFDRGRLNLASYNWALILKRPAWKRVDQRLLWGKINNCKFYRVKTFWENPIIFFSIITTKKSLSTLQFDPHLSVF